MFFKKQQTKLTYEINLLYTTKRTTITKFDVDSKLNSRVIEMGILTASIGICKRSKRFWP